MEFLNCKTNQDYELYIQHQCAMLESANLRKQK